MLGDSWTLPSLELATCGAGPRSTLAVVYNKVTICLDIEVGWSSSGGVTAPERFASGAVYDHVSIPLESQEGTWVSVCSGAPEGWAIYCIEHQVPVSLHG